MTTQQGPTPGPWTLIEHGAVGGNDYIQILAGSWDIAHNRFSARNWEEERANARLIAAAPTLLAAAEQAALRMELTLTACDDLDAHDDPCVHRLLTDAIQSARGNGEEVASG